VIERWHNPNGDAALAPVEFDRPDARTFGTVSHIATSYLLILLKAAGYVRTDEVAHDAFDIDAYEADGLKVEDA
jgi:hypothetical protein